MKLDEKTVERVFILTLVVLGIFYMYLASQTPLLGEDESSFLELGKDFSQLTYPIRENLRPMYLAPFVPLVFSIPFMIFGVSLSLAKMIIVVFGILTVFLVYLIGKRINIYYGLVSAFLLLSMTLFSHFMLIVYLEVPIALFSALLMYLFLGMDSYKKAVVTGVVLALAFFTKQTGLFLIAGILVYEAIYYFYKRDKNQLKFTFVSILIAAVLISPFLVRNITLYNYPFIHFANTLFKFIDTNLGWEGVTTKLLSVPMFTVQSYANNIGWLAVIAMVLTLVWFFLKAGSKQVSKELLVSVIFTFIFMVLYYIFYLTDFGISEPRNLFVIFPQFALIGGFFLWKLSTKKSYFKVLLLLVIALSAYTSITIAAGTAASQRYPDTYVSALEWVGKNTNQNDIILTTYGGSLKYFADRDNIWDGVKELPQIMSTTDSNYTYDIMKKYNVSYILIWRGVLNENFIIPESNLIGVFTVNFLNTVLSDTEHFNVTYQNQDDIVFKVL